MSAAVDESNTMTPRADRKRHRDGRPSRGRLRSFGRFVRQHPLVALAIVVLGLFVLMAVFADIIAPYPPEQQELVNRLIAPGAETRNGADAPLLGTDFLGRDVLSRIIAGSQVSLYVSTMATIIGGTIGLALGMMAGYFRGWLDYLFGIVANVQLSYPFVLLAITLSIVFKPSVTSTIFVLSATTWVVYARVVRSVTLSAREADYVTASVAIGSASPRILWKHIRSAVMAPFMVTATIQFARLIILESGLSYLGLGVPPTTPTWGGMLSEGQPYMLTAWWLATMPGLALVLVVLSINIVADYLSDRFDPRSRRRA